MLKRCSGQASRELLHRPSLKTASPPPTARLLLSSYASIQFYQQQQRRNVQYHASMPDIVDDKSPHVIPFILSRLSKHRERHPSSGSGSSTSAPPPPFFIGLNGVQGIGKTTLVTSLATTLRSPPHNLRTLTFSIDDLYLPRGEQEALARSDPQNPLIQQRGQPSTHDLSLGLEVFRSLRARQPDVRIPAYDKSAHAGKGDRVPPSEWEVVNRSGGGGGGKAGHEGSAEEEQAVEVVIFEGWCVGFRSLPDAELVERYERARQAEGSEKDIAEGEGTAAGRLRNQRLGDVRLINEALRTRGYDELFGGFLDAFVYLDAERTEYVYAWRLEQEAELRKKKGEGNAMSDADVIRFVDGYYPAYELFADRVREGVFHGDGGSTEGRQMRLVIGRDRSVAYTEVV